MATAEMVPTEHQWGSRESLSLGSLAGALAKAQGEFGAVVKDKRVSIRTDKGTYSYAYADLAGILAAVTPALNKNGLVMMQRPQFWPEAKAMVLETRLIHSSGEWMASIYPLPAAGSDPKAMGSAQTYARRYSATAMLGIAAEEDDDGDAASQREAPGTRADKRTHAPALEPARVAPPVAAPSEPPFVPTVINEAELTQLNAAMEASGLPVEEWPAIVLRVAGVKSRGQVPFTKFRALLKAFELVGSAEVSDIGPETAVIVDAHVNQEPRPEAKPSGGMPDCPQCKGKNKSVIKNNFKPGHFTCWKKARIPGCGHVWMPGYVSPADEPGAAEAAAIFTDSRQ